MATRKLSGIVWYWMNDFLSLCSIHSSTLLITRSFQIRNKGPSPANRPMTKTLGWLSDTHPLMEHGVTRNSLCFNTDNENICGERGEVQVRRCYGHYVYRFRLSFVPVRAGLSVEGDSTGAQYCHIMTMCT